MVKPWGKLSSISAIFKNNLIIMSVNQGYKPHGGEIWFRNFGFRSYGELMDEIENSERLINSWKEELKMMAMARPTDMYPQEEDLIFKVNSEFDSKWECIEDEMRKLEKMRLIVYMIEDWAFEDKITPQEAFDRVVVKED